MAIASATESHGAGRVLWASVFSDGPQGGNPAAVLLEVGGWTKRRMQDTAERLHCETVFVLPPRRDADIRLRYFLPRREIEACIHGTVAAVVLLARRGLVTHVPTMVETPLGVLRVDWNVLELRASVEQFPPRFLVTPPVLVDSVLSALGAPPHVLASDIGPVASVSTSRPKLMVPIRDEGTLDWLSPDFEALWELCDQLRVTGVYPFTVGACDADAAARQFPLRAGYCEDPATGVAACALAALSHEVWPCSAGGVA
jgi:trans-2,3-dihydro-3-hydroxyanthranilate isomerase